jgi:hypothetical protein
MSYMNSTLRIPLNTNVEQHARLAQLQSAFADVCNALSPTVQQTKVWNRVALHHLKYRSLRDQFPDMGSQMVCNAIYSVSRTCRMVFQHPKSPFNLTNMSDKRLPLLRFSDNCPVYFDRHTLSVKKGELSMYTLDGRLRFALALSAENEADFTNSKLREIVLSRRPDSTFELIFQFGEDPADSAGQSIISSSSELPEYVVVEEAQ